MEDEIISAEYKEALFIALRSAFHNEKVSFPENIDMEKLLHIAAHQNLFPFVFLSLMSNKEFESTEVHKKYLPQFMAAFFLQRRRTESFFKLYPKFVDSGICPVVVKGIVCRQLYGKFANCRPSGDEDILVKKSEFIAASKILEENGFTVERSDLTEKQIETLHHMEFKREDLKIELHSNLIDCRNELRKKMNSYFLSAVDDGVFVNIEGVTVKTLNHTDHFLYLVFHAFNHFILSGMGIRQMMDILMYYREYKDEIDVGYITRAVEDTNSKYFLSDMIRIGNKYLGFSIEPLCEEKDCEELLNDFLYMGVFGNSTNTHRVAGQMTSAAFSEGNTVLRAIFPSREWLSRRFPELIEKPYLLPICWVKRWLLFIKSEKDKDKIGDSMAVGKRRIELLKKYEVL